MGHFVVTQYRAMQKETNMAVLSIFLGKQILRFLFVCLFVCFFWHFGSL